MPESIRTGLVLACLVLAGFGGGCERRYSSSGVHQVSFVYDGDTFRLNNGDKVRLIGIDTPEEHDSDKLIRDARRQGVDVALIKDRGRRAHEFVKRFLEGRKVVIEPGEEKRDSYGRLLAYVYVPVPENWGDRKPDFVEIVSRTDPETKSPQEYIFLNATIVKAGYARPMAVEPNTRYKEYFNRLFQEARLKKRGLWGAEADRSIAVY